MGVRTLRSWQRNAIDRWSCAGRPSRWLTEATPGSGKTTYALALVRDLQSDATGTVTAVCPTAHLRLQWQSAAHREGIELCTDVPDGRLGRGYVGAALTYQQVLADPDRYRRVLGHGVIILDECHHAGEGRSWGEALMEAFEPSQFLLSLSGTAFRSDASRIPFVRYDSSGTSVADFRYSYGEALRDGVVRPVYFISYAGEMAWHKRGKTRTAGFDIALGREDAAARLRTALDAAGGWMSHAMENAHRRLVHIRATHPDAAGLIVCMDQTHARAIASRLAALTGQPPALALSDDPEASSIISRFAVGRLPWIVAVRQVSEGTDIPRLRVGVWATSATTELFFRQVVGRLVRTVQGLPDQDAYLFLPSDPTLLSHARALADERSHSLHEHTAPDGEQSAALTRTPAADGDFSALGSTATSGVVVAAGQVLHPDELLRACELATELGLPLDDPIPLALALRQAAGGGGSLTLPSEVRRKALRELLSTRVRQLCARTGNRPRDVFAGLKSRAGRGVDKLDEAGLAAHVRRIELRLEFAHEPPQEAG